MSPEQQAFLAALGESFEQHDESIKETLQVAIGMFPDGSDAVNALKMHEYARGERTRETRR